MSPRPQEICFVTDDDTEGMPQKIAEDTDSMQEAVSARLAWYQRLRKGFRHMAHMEPRGNSRPEIGMHCIIMVGTEQDRGQMAQVVDRKAQMVGVKFRAATNRRMEYKVKRPSSLIMLESGLTMKQDAHGSTVWVCANKE